MGGNVRIAVRTRGVVECREVTTGFIQDLVQRMSFLMDSESHPRWEARPLVEDLCPLDYGLVVIDRDTRWVGSLQAYCSTDKFLLGRLDHPDDERGRGWMFAVPEADPPSASRELFLEAWRAGAITDMVFDGLDEGEACVQSWASFARRRKWTAANPSPLWRWLESAQPRRPAPDSRAELQEFGFAPPGWHFESFPTTAAGVASLFQALRERGFAVDHPGCAAEWDAHIDAMNQQPPNTTFLIRSLAMLEPALDTPRPRARTSARL